MQMQREMRFIGEPARPLMQSHRVGKGHTEERIISACDALQDVRQEQGECGVLDLKAYYRGAKYVEETIKLLPKMPEPVLLERIVAKVVGIGRIHAAPADHVPA